MTTKKINVLDQSLSSPRRTVLAAELSKLCAGIGLVGALALAVPGLASAEDAKKPTFDFQGYVDAAYSHLSESGLFTSETANRVFDTEPDAFNLHQAAVFVNINAMEKWGGYVNLTAGRDARIIKSFDTTTNDFDVTQAYMRYAGDKTTFIAGKFATLAGAEVIDSRSLPVYSRGILFGYAVPFTHTGVRATFAPSKTFGVTVGLNNGWDQMKDMNDDKTFELGISVTPSEKFALTAQYYTGKEGNLGATATRDLLDIVMTISPNDKLSLIFNYDDGSQKSPFGGQSADWNGLAAYLKYKLSDKWGLVFRTERFDDKQGFRTGVVQKWDESTIGFSVAPATNAEIRFEARWDKSNKNSFLSKDFFTTESFVAGGSQNSYAVEFLYKF
jgi:hypothetical protein